MPQPQAAGPESVNRIRQSFRLKAGLRTRKSRLVRLRKIFLPIKFSCPTFRGSAPTSSPRSIPTARHSPARPGPTRPFSRLIKPPIEGRKIVWVGRFSQPQPPDQNPSILPPKCGTTHSEKPARPSPKNFPTNKIFLPRIPRLGTDVFHSFNSLRPARHGSAQPVSD